MTVVERPAAAHAGGTFAPAARVENGGLDDGPLVTNCAAPGEGDGGPR
ncbi:hypothetical protein KZZ52_34075 [Dactylosporangium sp. AC04546]|nr:hypothetical protein [Dactylosporangium sp. AC04546]WVK79001.1 hypothetical protein KZZ52_34075 [Dactylosporangium sp. AC04546]